MTKDGRRFSGLAGREPLIVKDAVLVFSVGGGDLENHVSPNLVEALNFAKQRGAATLGIVGRDGGYTAKVADACVVIPTVNPEHVTPHSGGFPGGGMAPVVSHPSLKKAQTKWESVAGAAPSK